MMDDRISKLIKQFKGITEDLEKSGKDNSVEASLLALIASLLFVLIEQGQATTMQF